MTSQAKILKTLAKAEGLNILDLVITENLGNKRPSSLSLIVRVVGLLQTKHYVTLIRDMIFPTSLGLQYLTLAEAYKPIK